MISTFAIIHTTISTGTIHGMTILHTIGDGTMATIISTIHSRLTGDTAITIHSIMAVIHGGTHGTILTMMGSTVGDGITAGATDHTTMFTIIQTTAT